MVFRASTEHPDISHRPQRSVSEESEAPLELPQPLSDLLDGSVSSRPALAPTTLGETCPGGAPRCSTCSGVTAADSKPDSPSQTHPLPSLQTMGSDPSTCCRDGFGPSSPRPSSASGRTQTWLSITTHACDRNPL